MHLYSVQTEAILFRTPLSANTAGNLTVSVSTRASVNSNSDVFLDFP